MHYIRAPLADKVRVSEQQKNYTAEPQSLGGLVADDTVRICVLAE
jgi:hypothetical protein